MPLLTRLYHQPEFVCVDSRYRIVADENRPSPIEYTYEYDSANRLIRATYFENANSSDLKIERTILFWSSRVASLVTPKDLQARKSLFSFFQETLNFIGFRPANEKNREPEVKSSRHALQGSDKNATSSETDLFRFDVVESSDWPRYVTTLETAPVVVIELESSFQSVNPKQLAKLLRNILEGSGPEKDGSTKEVVPFVKGESLVKHELEDPFVDYPQKPEERLCWFVSKLKINERPIADLVNHLAEETDGIVPSATSKIPLMQLARQYPTAAAHVATDLLRFLNVHNNDITKVREHLARLTANREEFAREVGTDRVTWKRSEFIEALENDHDLEFFTLLAGLLACKK